MFKGAQRDQHAVWYFLDGFDAVFCTYLVPVLHSQREEDLL